MSHNRLPLQLTSFIGREREIAEVVRALETTRLLTLTGAGGAGKTRLALQVASGLVDEYADGVWFVDLSPLSEAGLVMGAIAAVFDLRESKDVSLSDTLRSYLRDRHLLLVLDACEHFVDACARIADLLLRACEGLTILATSRQVLGIAGETTMRVPSLALPDPESAPPDALASSEAVRLFVERATAADHAFKCTNQNVAAIARICQQLDGMPLAIELAAARARSLAVEEIAARLASHDRFRLLSQGSRTAPTRQQTLRAVIDWSYDSLSDEERNLFRRLSVFAGGWNLEAAEHIGDQAVVLDALIALADKSLVVVDQKDAGMRYRLLETVKQYAHEKLAEANELATARTRHVQYFLKLAEQARPQFGGADHKLWLDRLESEFANLRAAWDWAIDIDAGIAVRMGWALLEFWGAGWHLPEARRWMERLLPYTEGWGASPKRARALTVAGTLACNHRDYALACELLELGLALAQATASKFDIAFASVWLGFSNFFIGKFQTARELAESSIPLWRELGDELSLVRAQYMLASVMRDQGEFDKANGIYAASLEKFQILGNERHAAMVLNAMGVLAQMRGDYRAAAEFYRRCIEKERASGRTALLAIATGNLGMAALRSGDYGEARAYLAEALVLEQQLGRRDMICLNLVGLAGVIGMLGKPDHAARLLGMVEATFENTAIVLQPVDQHESDYIRVNIRAELDQATFENARVQGRDMTLQQAIEFALAESAPATQPTMPVSAHDPNALTPRELEVVRLVADGLSDAQIAEKLVISPRTVNTHLGSIYGKLGVKSRSAAVHHAQAQKLI